MIARTIDIALWTHPDNNSTKCDITTDSITKDLKTTNNTLSFWKISDIKDIGQVVLAWITSRDKITDAYVTWLDDDFSVKKEIECVEVDGETLVEDLKNWHRDLANLNFWKIGYISLGIIEQVEKNNYLLFEEGDVEQLVYDAVCANRISIEVLPKKIKKRIIEMQTGV